MKKIRMYLDNIISTLVIIGGAYYVRLNPQYEWYFQFIIYLLIGICGLGFLFVTFSSEAKEKFSKFLKDKYLKKSYPIRKLFSAAQILSFVYLDYKNLAVTLTILIFIEMAIVLNTKSEFKKEKDEK